MLSLLIIALILGIVFFQAVHGVFSSLIMALCTLVCTLLAFNFYEPLAALLGLYKTQPAYADGIVLIGLLVAPLFVLRFVVDNYLPGNVVPTVWVDRIGGGVFGLITALLLVGTMVISLEMLPFDRDLLGYDSYDDSLVAKDSLLIDAPGFTLGVVNKLSSGSMKGSASFAARHENLTLESWAVRNRDKGARTDCLVDDLELTKLIDVTAISYPGDDPKITYKTGAPDYPGASSSSESKVYMARVKIAETARDTDDWFRLRCTQFRLMTAEGRGYFPVAYLVNMGQWRVIADEIGLMQISRQKLKGDLTADLLFRVPFGSDQKPAKLAELVFRRTAHAPVAKIITAKGAADLPDGKLALKIMAKQTDRVAVTGPGLKAFFKPTMALVNASSPAPFTRSTQQGEPELMTVKRSFSGAVVAGEVIASRSALKHGAVSGTLESLGFFYKSEDNPTTRVATIDKLIAPQGTTMVKLRGEPLQSKRLAILATIFQASIRCANQEDRRAVGVWYKWRDGARESVKLYYQPNQDEYATFDKKLNDVIREAMNKRGSVSEIGLIFLAPVNATVLNFSLNNETYTCESPLDLDRRRRRRR